MLGGLHSPRQIVELARDEWSFCTLQRKSRGGRPLSASAIYKLLGNPFYAGLIVWNGQCYPGKHEPVLTLDEFDRVQQRLKRREGAHPRRYEFAYTGLIRCGSCGLRVTAEHKLNRQGHRYLYYHCSRRNVGPRCREPVIEVKALERQILDFLETISIDPQIEQWVLGELATGEQHALEVDQARRRSLEAALSETVTQAGELTGLRLRRLLSDDEFKAQRHRLEGDQARLRAKLAAADQTEDRFEPLRDVLAVRKQAVNWFACGNDRKKRLILQTVGSNLTLTDKKLSIQALKPFVQRPIPTARSLLCGAVHTNRTCPAAAKPLVRRFIKALLAALHEPECEKLPAAMKELRELCEDRENRKAA
jgi:site-specific DNA recombinase